MTTQPRTCAQCGNVQLEGEFCEQCGAQLPLAQVDAAVIHTAPPAPPTPSAAAAAPAVPPPVWTTPPVAPAAQPVPPPVVHPAPSAAAAAPTVVTSAAVLGQAASPPSAPPSPGPQAPSPGPQAPPPAPQAPPPAPQVVAPPQPGPRPAAGPYAPPPPQYPPTGYPPSQPQPVYPPPGGYGAPPQGPFGRSAGGGDGFFASLFDFSFHQFVTPKIIKLLFILALIGIGFAVLGMIVAGFSQGFGTGILFLILSPIFGFVYVLLARLGLEVVVVLFRIEEHAATVAGEKKGS